MRLEKRRKRSAVAVGVLAVAAFLSVHADTYQFIISGHPAENVSYFATSAGTTLVTATRTGRSSAVPVEARFRTWNASNGVALRTDKFVGTVILLR